MSETAVTDRPGGEGLVLPDLLPTCRAALSAAADLREDARCAVAGLVAPGGKVDAALLDREQFAAHGFAWLSTYVAALREMLGWAERLEAVGRARELEHLILQAAFGEYLQQMTGGQELGQAQARARAATGGQGRDRRVAAERRDRTFVEAEVGGARALDLAQRDAAHHLSQVFGEAELEDQPLELA